MTTTIADADKESPANMQILVMGQAVTARTETIEAYLKSRCSCLATVAVPGVRQRFPGHSTVHVRRSITHNGWIPSFPVKGGPPYFIPMIFCYYLLQSLAVTISVLRMRKKFEIAIGVSTFYALLAIFLKRIDVVERVVYYSIDYYPSQSFINAMFRHADRFCVKKSDVIWNLSAAISKARSRRLIQKIAVSEEIPVPLTYDSTLMISRSLDEIEGFHVGFVGTIEKLQGLQLLVKSMPLILKELPTVMIKVIGDGPYLNELRRLAERDGVSDHFVFYGFVKDDSTVIDILSKCAIGIAPYVPVPENNAMNADPGKPKFYASLGLPTITTKIPSGVEIEESGAGITIDYNAEALADAVVGLLRDSQTLAIYKKRASEYARRFTSEKVLGDALRTTVKLIRAGELHNRE